MCGKFLGANVLKGQSASAIFSAIEIIDIARWSEIWMFYYRLWEEVNKSSYLIKNDFLRFNMRRIRYNSLPPTCKQKQRCGWLVPLNLPALIYIFTYSGVAFSKSFFGCHWHTGFARTLKVLESPWIWKSKFKALKVLEKYIGSLKNLDICCLTVFT